MNKAGYAVLALACVALGFFLVTTGIAKPIGDWMLNMKGNISNIWTQMTSTTWGTALTTTAITGAVGGAVKLVSDRKTAAVKASADQAQQVAQGQTLSATTAKNQVQGQLDVLQKQYSTLQQAHTDIQAKYNQSVQSVQAENDQLKAQMKNMQDEYNAMMRVKATALKLPQEAERVE